jgi:antagonist of KipI
MANDKLETLTVVSPGFHTLIVDQGRPRTRSLGVPVGGAADRRALALGNALVGNEAEAAALEINLAGPALRSSSRIAAVVFGAAVELTSDQRPLTAGTTFTFERNETVRIGALTDGMRAYLCVGGGIRTPLILRSRSSLAPIVAGDQLACLSGTISPRFFRHLFRGDQSPHRLRALDGPQASWFGLDELYRQEFRVAPQSDRMGLRLIGGTVATDGREMDSEPMCPGSVQVTHNGQCIVLGVDGQTIGGYPKIAQVIAADLDKIAQLRPGTAIRFERVTLAEGETIYHEQQVELHQWLTRLRTAAGSDSYDG